MTTRSIMIVEDNETMRLGMVESLRRDGYRIKAFADATAALSHFEKSVVPFVITDLRMDGMNGLELLKRIKQIAPQTEVVMVSAFGTVEVAVEAMNLGAVDFLTKPFSMEELRARVNKVFEKLADRQKIEQLAEENRLLREEFESDMIGESEEITALKSLLQRIAQQDSTVLIEGESGTGKELAARAVHSNSARAAGPFIKLNCSALNDNLLESELFGHEKGAFTGAVRQKRGRFELANGGTLFLDEIGDISPAMQVRLLRVLQEKQFERVGGEETLSVDVRIIAATHQNLPHLVQDGSFREDLYYRLSVVPVKLPPLRQRPSDIPLLVDHFLKKHSVGKQRFKIDADGMNVLQSYHWPGNIRELENILERLTVVSATDQIDVTLIAAQLGSVGMSLTSSYEDLPLDDAVDRFEKTLIIHALKKADGVKNRAAKLLGVKTSSLYYKLEKYGLM